MGKRNEYHISEYALWSPEDSTVYTVIRWDEDGVSWDLNAEGKPCKTKAELIEFICELYAQGAFSEDVRRSLIEEAIA